MFRSVKCPMFLLLFLLALFIAVNGAFSLSVGYAEGASQNGQIVSAKIEWVTPDSPSDGQAAGEPAVYPEAQRRFGNQHAVPDQRRPDRTGTA